MDLELSTKNNYVGLAYAGPFCNLEENYMQNTVKKLISQACAWTGYLEKASNKELDCFKANAGSNNYTCFARDYKVHTGGNYQGQPWCAMFVSEVFVQVFGLDVAKKLLGGSLYHNCQTGVEQFEKAGRWSNAPEPGAVVFFTNSQRAYHTGIVTEVTVSRIKTVEGNTSGASGVIPNGGGVCQKSYARNYSKILGYGLPDWSLVNKSGWHQEDDGWRYYLGNTGEPISNDWHQEDNGDWYWFDGAGMMVHDTWKTGKDGKWYYLGPDGKMLKDTWLLLGQELFQLNPDGSMFEGQMILRTDGRGVLKPY